MLLSIENSWRLGISEVFVIAALHLNFCIVGFCRHSQLFLTVQLIAGRKRNGACYKKISAEEELGVKSAFSTCKFS